MAALNITDSPYGARDIITGLTTLAVPVRRVQQGYRYWLSDTGIVHAGARTFQAYLGTSKVFGKYGEPWDARIGVNWFPYKNRVVRWNAEGRISLKSPVGNTSLPYNVEQRVCFLHELGTGVLRKRTIGNTDTNKKAPHFAEPFVKQS